MQARVALVQFACVLGDVDANLAGIEAAVADVAGVADLVVFPEMATTGSNLGGRLGDLAEAIPGSATDRLERAAAAAGVHVVLGIAERRAGGGLPHNSAVWIDPSRGLCQVYRKVHLFSGERECFTPGDRPAWVDAPWGRTALTICYDLCFPEYVRALALADATLVLNSTHWFADAATAPWGWSGAQVRALAVARALENGLFVGMACRAGDEDDWRALGYSTLAGPSGRVEAGLEAGPGAAVGLIDPASVTAWRSVATYLADRRTDLYRAIVADGGAAHVAGAPG